jgi:DNA polymerase-3 subunit alpha
MLENTIHLDEYINHAVENGFSFLTITDNNLHGHFKFQQLCKKNNIKPIIGLKMKINSFVGRNNYVLAYAKNHQGYISLLHLATMMEKEGIVSDEFIQANSKGIVFVSSAIDADLDYYIFEQKYALFNDELQRLQNLGDVFYLGIMPSSFIYDTIYQDLNLMIEKHNLLTLPIAKCSYLLKEDEIVYQTIIKLNEQKIIAGLDDLHLKTKNELEVEFKDHYAIFDNLELFVNQIEEDIIYTKHDLPKYPNKYGLPSENYLQGLCEKGLERRLANKNLKVTNEYLKRLKYELDVINKMGYADYFLIVWDFVRFAKQNDVLVGPGRGSAAGSLVAYCLGITEIDPIEYDLLFERFLNPERISMPDIDMDFPDDKRDFVINYVKDKYGIDHVCYISAFGTFQIKSAIRDLFRIFGYDQKYIEPIIRFLEANPTQEEIDEEFKTHPELIELIMIARKMENRTRGRSL